MTGHGTQSSGLGDKMGISQVLDLMTLEVFPNPKGSMMSTSARISKVRASTGVTCCQAHRDARMLIYALFSGILRLHLVHLEMGCRNCG